MYIKRQKSKYPISGVYAITNKSNDMVYIGRSMDIQARWEEHKFLLNNNKHHNTKLQYDWNDYPKECFEFKILEKCKTDISKYREIYYFFQFKNIYNNISESHKITYDICNYLDSLNLNDFKYRYCYHTTYQNNKIPWDLYIKYKNNIIVILYSSSKDEFWENRINYINTKPNITFVYNKITRESNLEYIYNKFKTAIDSAININIEQ